MRGIVLRSTAGFYRVRTDDGRVVDCKMRGRLKKERARTDLAVIGDEVEIDTQLAVIDAVMPRRTKFSRLHPTSRGTGHERAWEAGKTTEDVLVANLDRVLCVFSASTPRMNPRLVDRFLVVAEHNDVEPWIVANKMDEPEAADAHERFAMYESIGYRVLYTSARTGLGIDALREGIHGRITALTGPSGVGKSSLLNAVQPGLALAVGEISELLHKGKHTTRVAELHPVEGGGFVADTPGIRELASFAIPPRDLARCFPELRAPMEHCGFSDCLHDHEPQCGVREAVQRGEVDPARYDSYLRQLHGEDARA